MSKANFNIAKAITLLSEVISDEAAIVPPRTLDAFGNEVEEEETVTASVYTDLCNETEDYSNDITDALELLKDEIDQVLEDQSEDGSLDDEFSDPGWPEVGEDFDSDDDADDDDSENGDDDDAVQEELPLGDTPVDEDNTDDETETPLAFNEETYNKMQTAYTEMEEHKEDLQRCLESTLDSITAILADSETFRNNLDSDGVDIT